MNAQANAQIEPWRELRSKDQNDLLQPICRDLSRCLTWYGFKLSQDDWRHFLSGTVKGFRMLPGINRGKGAPGFVMLGGSSRDLLKAECTEAIELAFALGDAPWEYEPTQTKPVHWCDVVMIARGFNPSDFEVSNGN